MKSAPLAPYVYNVSRLPNGLRSVVCRMESRVSYIGVAVNAGSRDESPDHPGLAHFVEHTIFKGTRHRKSWHISNRMESIGGELNAYTSKETTVIYTIAPAGDPERAIELLADLIRNSIFPKSELSKEKEVVIEEIKASLDTPAEVVFDTFERRMFAGNGLGHDILGTPESVRALDSADCREFIDRFYTPGEMVVFAQDPGDPAKIMRYIEKHFGSMHFPDTGRRRKVPEPAPDFSETIDRNGHQAHTIIGSQVFDRFDTRKYALFLYNSYLAGPSMNSRLNQLLRERHGLVYTVDSSVTLMSDTGMQYVYFGADRELADRCVKIIRREMEELADKQLKPSVFDKLKTQYCGQLLVNSDNRESTAMSMGRSLLFFDSIHDAATAAQEVGAVTPEQLREVAGLVASRSFHRLTLC